MVLITLAERSIDFYKRSTIVRSSHTMSLATWRTGVEFLPFPTRLQSWVAEGSPYVMRNPQLFKYNSGSMQAKVSHGYAALITSRQGVYEWSPNETYSIYHYLQFLDNFFAGKNLQVPGVLPRLLSMFGKASKSPTHYMTINQDV
jgi:hypothetical protein